MKKQVTPKISYQGNRLIAEWDNREIPRNFFLTVVLACIWTVWTPLTLFLTYAFFFSLRWSVLFSGEWAEVLVGILFLLLWLFFGYTGLILIARLWMLRWMLERVELDDKIYRHCYLNMPNWFSCEWATEELAQIALGSYNNESISTLNIHWGSKRDMIAYWAHDDFHLILFNALSDHVALLGAHTPVVDLRETS